MINNVIKYKGHDIELRYSIRGKYAIVDNDNSGVYSLYDTMSEAIEMAKMDIDKIKKED